MSVVTGRLDRVGSHSLPVGKLELGRFPETWHYLEELQRVAESLDKRYAKDVGLCARKIDEAQPAGRRVYASAWQQLGAGMEHLQTLRHVLVQLGATPRTPWVLVRAMFEAGFWATWLLEPDDGMARRRRGLRFEVRAAADRETWLDSLLKQQPNERDELRRHHETHERNFRSEAEALGLSWAQARQRINVTEELPKLTAVRRLGTELDGAALAQWRGLSGLSHGSAYTMAFMSDMSNERRTPGGAEATFTINDAAFEGAAQTANLLLIEGFGLLIRRMERP